MRMIMTGGYLGHVGAIHLGPVGAIHLGPGPGPIWAHSRGFICWALLGPFICWALLGPFIWEHLNWVISRKIIIYLFFMRITFLGHFLFRRSFVGSYFRIMSNPSQKALKPTFQKWVLDDLTHRKDTHIEKNYHINSRFRVFLPWYINSNGRCVRKSRWVLGFWGKMDFPKNRFSDMWTFHDFLTFCWNKCFDPEM